MTLTKGNRYNLAILTCTGWVNPQGADLTGYQFEPYFSTDGVYKGADECGVEPVMMLSGAARIAAATSSATKKYGAHRVVFCRCTGSGPGFTVRAKYVCVTHCTGMVTVWDDDNCRDTMSNGCFTRHFTLVH